MKEFIRFLFSGCFSNQEVIDNSKMHSYLSSILVLLFSLIISVIPSFVTIAKTTGSSVITSSTNASVDTSLVLLSKYLNDNNLDIVIDNQKLDTTATTMKEEVIIKSSKDEELLAVRCCTTEGEATTYGTMYSSGKTSLDSAASVTPRSYLIFTTENFYLKTYLNTATNTLAEDGTVSKSATANATYSGQLKCVTSKISIKDFYSSNDYTTCINSWKSLLNTAYKAQKTTYLWSYTGILVAVNLAIVLLVSLLVMILTRLKSSTGEKLNYFEAFKIMGFASFSPAIIALVLGFLMSTFASIGFVLCIGLRSTFLSMKASNPQRGQ